MKKAKNVKQDREEMVCVVLFRFFFFFFFFFALKTSISYKFHMHCSCAAITPCFTMSNSIPMNTKALIRIED